MAWIPGSGRSTGGGHSKPLQYSCLENPMDRGVWQAVVHRSAKSRHDWSDLAHGSESKISTIKVSLGLSIALSFWELLKERSVPTSLLGFQMVSSCSHGTFISFYPNHFFITVLSYFLDHSSGIIFFPSWNIYFKYFYRGKLFVDNTNCCLLDIALFYSLLIYSFAM